MESIQPVRPPMSQQPPQRIDVDNNNNNNNQQQTQQQQQTSSTNDNNKTEIKQAEKNKNQRDCNIPDVDISIAYKRKSLKHRIECGISVRIGNDEIQELKRILGERKCQMYKNNECMSSCVVCDEQCDNQGGEFAVETVLFIPNKNDPAYDNLGRFRIELPRISCRECAAEYATINNIKTNNNGNNIILSLGKTWQNYQSGDLKSNINNNNNNNKQLSHSSAQSASLSGVGNIAGMVSPVGGAGNDDDNKMDNNKRHLNNNNNDQQQQQQTQQQGKDKTAGDNNNNNNNNGMCEAERDPFDDGFLICTQLVKTGGADQGGLQVGDVFVEFGHYSKKRFPGLKSIANLVRRSAGKEINVVVWRKLEQMNGVEDDGSGRTVFQKLALKLKPLQSHDADGGGVLGAVINTYPLPEMKN